LGASILPAVAASDSKTQSGIACKPRIHTQPYYLEAGAIWNLSGVEQEYLCPVLRDVMKGDSDGVDDFWMQVYDRHPDFNVRCTFYSMRSNGTVRASIPRETAGYSSLPKPLDFPALAREKDGFYLVKCLVPADHSENGSSGILMYRIQEEEQ
jgi:hypothetical protein